MMNRIEEIQEIDWGVANTIDGKIYLNKHLKEFPDIYIKVLQHEREHEQAKGFLEHRKIDAKTSLTFKDLIPFFKKYPKYFIQQYLPISYKDNIILFEPSLLILYSLFLGLLGLVYFLIKTFSADNTFFWLVIKNLVIGLGIVLGVYFGIKWIVREINKQGKELPEGKKDQLSKLKALSGQ